LSFGGGGGGGVSFPSLGGVAMGALALRARRLRKGSRRELDDVAERSRKYTGDERAAPEVEVEVTDIFIVVNKLV
jgi:hypothetical protein